MFEIDNNGVRFTFSRKTICIVSSLWLLLICIYFYVSGSKELPDINKDISLSSKNIDSYLEAILDASKNSDIVENKGFSDIIDHVYQGIIKGYSDQLSFTEEEKKKLLDNYHSKRSLIINNIHDTMTNRESYSEKKEYKYEYLDSVNGFSESLSAFSCGVLQFALSETGHGHFAKNMITDSICKDILIEIVSPVTQLLKDKAIVKDVNNITFNMKERIISSVLQLATSRDIYEFDIEDKYTRIIEPFENTRFDCLKKTMRSERNSEIRAKIKAAVTAGFDLKDLSMNVNHEERLLSIYLPSPEIISSNVAVEYTGEDSEILAPKIDHHSYNNISEKARRQLQEKAINSDLFQRAKENAALSITNIFQPLMSMPQFNYKVKIYFDNKMITTEGNKE